MFFWARLFLDMTLHLSAMLTESAEKSLCTRRLYGNLKYGIRLQHHMQPKDSYSNIYALQCYDLFVIQSQKHGKRSVHAYGRHGQQRDRTERITCDVGCVVSASTKIPVLFNQGCPTSGI